MVGQRRRSGEGGGAVSERSERGCEWRLGRRLLIIPVASLQVLRRDWLRVLLHLRVLRAGKPPAAALPARKESNSGIFAHETFQSIQL